MPKKEQLHTNATNCCFILFSYLAQGLKLAAVILNVVWESVTKFQYNDVRSHAAVMSHDYPNKCAKNICSCVKIVGTPSLLHLCIGSPYVSLIWLKLTSSKLMV